MGNGGKCITAKTLVPYANTHPTQTHPTPPTNLLIQG
jgi:hypothetical protein